MNINDLKQIDNLLNKRFIEFEQRIISELGKFMEDHLFPILEEKADKKDLKNLENTVDRIERKLDHFSAKATEHDQRLDRIESTPTVAHELKR